MSLDHIHTSGYDRPHAGNRGLLHTLPDGSYVRVEQNDGWRSVEWPTRLGAVAALATVKSRYSIEAGVVGDSSISIGSSPISHNIAQVNETTGFWRVDTKDGSAFQWEKARYDTERPRFGAVVPEEELTEIIRATATENVIARISEIDLRVK